MSHKWRVLPRNKATKKQHETKILKSFVVVILCTTKDFNFIWIQKLRMMEFTIIKKKQGIICKKRATLSILLVHTYKIEWQMCLASPPNLQLMTMVMFPLWMQKTGCIINMTQRLLGGWVSWEVLNTTVEVYRLETQESISSTSAECSIMLVT